MTNIGISKPIQEGGSWDKTPESATPEEAAPWREIAKNILPYIGARLFFGVLVLLFTVFLTYLGVEMAGGEPLEEAFRLATPQTWGYLTRLAQGDLGLTTSGSETLLPREVGEVIRERLPRSLGLLGISLAVASLIGVFLGVTAARGRPGRSLWILITTIIGVSVPSFFAAFLLQWAATTYTRQVGQSLLPVGGFGWDAHLILPVLVLAARPVAQITRVTFVSVREILGQDYIRTAQSKGLHRLYILLRHTMRNAAIPILTTIGVSLRFSLSSLPVVELYFGWTGAGLTLLKSISRADDNLTIALILCFGILFILMNVFLDIAYRLIDPRLSSREAQAAQAEQVGWRARLSATWANLKDLVLNNTFTHWVRNRRRRNQDEQLNGRAINSVAARLDEDLPNPGLLRVWRPVWANFPLLVGSLLLLGLLVLILFGPNLSPNNPFTTQGLVQIDGKLTPPPFAPNETFPWGTDALGRGIMSLIFTGAQQTLFLAVLAVAARMLVGVLLGAVAGWASGSLVDRIILGLAEIISAFPTLLLGMILILAFGIRQGIMPFILALCFVGWGEIMLFVRGEVIGVRPEAYIESAVAVGARTPRIIGRHVLPNLFSSLISITSLEMGAVLMLLGELGFISIFIGGGALIELPTMVMHYSDVPEWGALLSNVRLQARSYPWTGIYPMVAFFLAILSFNLFGEGFRRLVDSGSLVINRLINRYTVSIFLLAIVGVRWVQANSGTLPFYRADAQTFSGQQAAQLVGDLTDPMFEGRSLGSEGHSIAAQYIAYSFEAYGLQPAGEGGTFFQNRSHSFQTLDAIPRFSILDGGPEPVYRRDFVAYPGRNMTQGVADAPVRFIGLGELPSTFAGGFRTRYPKLTRADYTGEVLLVLSDREARVLANIPKDGLLVVTDNPDLFGRRYTLSGRPGTLINIFTGVQEGGEVPSIWISEAMAERLLAGSGETLDSLQATVEGLPFEDLYELPLSQSVSMEVEGTLVSGWPVQHVIGYLPGTAGYEGCQDCLDRDMIVVMAQYDNPPVGPEGEIFPGANDNASSVAVMLEALRVMNDSDYQPFRTFLFVAYTGEGLDGGEPVSNPDVNRFLQAKTGFARIFDIEAVVILRGLGAGAGDRLEVSAGGSLRLAELFEEVADQMGVDAYRSNETIDISLIYDEISAFQSGQEAPTVRLFWEGWQETSRRSTDTLESISPENLEQAGETLALSLMILGRETQY